jgi:hypothetical protein
MARTHQKAKVSTGGARPSAQLRAKLRAKCKLMGQSVVGQVMPVEEVDDACADVLEEIDEIDEIMQLDEDQEGSSSQAVDVPHYGDHEVRSWTDRLVLLLTETLS